MKSEALAMTSINESVTDSIRRASLALGKDIEISLIEQLLNLVNIGVIEVSYLIPTTTFDLERTKATLESAVGVRFRGKERIIELESKLSTQSQIIEKLEAAVRFYASDEAWYKNVSPQITTMRSIRYNDTETDDSNRSHYIVRGGKLARTTLAEVEKMKASISHPSSDDSSSQTVTPVGPRNLSPLVDGKGESRTDHSETYHSTECLVQSSDESRERCTCR